MKVGVSRVEFAPNLDVSSAKETRQADKARLGKLSFEAGGVEYETYCLQSYPVVPQKVYLDTPGTHPSPTFSEGTWRPRGMHSAIG